MFGSAKLVMIGIVAIGLSGGAAYVYKLKADNVILKENNIKLEESVSSQQAVIEQQKKDFLISWKRTKDCKKRLLL